MGRSPLPNPPMCRWYLWWDMPEKTTCAADDEEKKGKSEQRIKALRKHCKKCKFVHKKAREDAADSSDCPDAPA